MTRLTAGGHEEPFVGFAVANEAWIRTFEQCRERVNRSGALEAAKRFATAQGAPNWVPIPHPLTIDAADHARLVVVAEHVLAAQTTILQHLLQTCSHGALLDMFGLRETLEPYIDWEALASGRNAIGRFDIIPSGDHYWFCEHNSDSALGATEIYECIRVYADELGLPLLADQHSPALDAAMFVRGLVKGSAIKRVALCDWSSYRDVGLFDFGLLCAAVQRALPAVEVRLFYEDTYPTEWLEPDVAKNTLVYRCFMHDDMTDDGAFYRRLTNSGASIVNMFETEIRTHKSWFGMYGEARYRRLLTSEQLDVIDRYVPVTLPVTNENVRQIVADKDQYVFKVGRATSGRGVVMGRELSTRELSARLKKGKRSDWTVQRCVEADIVQLRRHDTGERTGHRVVLGLYMIDGRASGLLIRANDQSGVVSGARGSTWCTPLPEGRRNELIEGLSRSHGDEPGHARPTVAQTADDGGPRAPSPSSPIAS